VTTTPVDLHRTKLADAHRAMLVAAMRRASRLVAEKRTDLAEAELPLAADVFTDSDRFAREHVLVREAPQLVGYASELPAPGHFVTKDVCGLPVLLTRASDGLVRAFWNVCRHRQAPVAEGCGKRGRLLCPYHAWTYELDGSLAKVPGSEGFPGAADRGGLTEIPAAEYAGFLWVGLDPDRDLDIADHLGELGPELAGWDVGSWTPVGEKRLDADINWKLALDTFAENYHFATVHRDTFAQIAPSNRTAFDAFGRHHRLVFPLHGIGDAAQAPEDEWNPLASLVVIYALYPNIVLSATAYNGEVFRVYPGTVAGESTTYHQNAARFDPSDEAQRAGAEQVFDYAHGTVRDEDYTLAARVQTNLASGVLPTLTVGRNEPGVQHRHCVVEAALSTR
jgi:phenylpropionate dioxygenase-like ring-hydroxylating dioxygenase large terminal subunit